MDNSILIDAEKVKIGRKRCKYNNTGSDTITTRLYKEDCDVKHENIGIYYLTEMLGYKIEDIHRNYIQGIYDQNVGAPDLYTTDGKEWEIKKLESTSVVRFAQHQYKKFDNNVNVLIFKQISRHEYVFLGCIKFGDIRSRKLGHDAYNLDGRKYQYRFKVTFEVDLCMTSEI